jgi:hypothetical protein
VLFVVLSELKFIFLTVIFLLPACLLAQHLPTWKAIDPANPATSYTAFDMLNARAGLLAITDKNFSGVSKYVNGVLTNVFVTPVPQSRLITALLIKDQNAAYISVTGDGLYEATNGWNNFSNIYSDPDLFLLAVNDKEVLVNLEKKLNYSSDGGASFHSTHGISPTDTVVAVEYYSGKTALALTGKHLYRSADGGQNWTLILDSLIGARTFYIDHTHGISYIGSSKLLSSADSGVNWGSITSLFFDSLPGPISGARDCSGNFYIGPSRAGNNMYRTVNGGKFFQDAGSSWSGSTALKKGIVFDRGSTIFFLDSNSGILTVVHDGIDSTITDSVRDRIKILEDSGITNSLCPGVQPVSFNVSLTYDQCTGIDLQSLTQVTTNAAFTAKLTPGFLGNATIAIPFTYRAARPGPDTVHYVLQFQSPVTQNTEKKFIDVIAFGKSGSPELSLSNTELDFPVTKVDTTTKLSLVISNPGCDNLVVDSAISTNPAVYVITAAKFPITVTPGKSTTITAAFSPHIEGEYLESLEIGTNVGSRYITLLGFTPHSVQGVVPSDEVQRLRIYPNPADKSMTLSATTLPKNIFIRDLLGREALHLTTAGTSEFTFSVESLPSGIYILDTGISKLERIIIAH